MRDKDNITERQGNKCWKCGDPAVIHRKYEGKSWCSEHFTEQFESLVKGTIRENDLFESDDKVCVALSGGMDSSALLFFLSDLFKDWRNADLFALAIDEGIEDYRDESIEIAEELCRDLGVDLHIASFKEAFGKTLDEIMEDKEYGCTYCGVLRRWLLNRKSRELGATKLATGHNMDDELQSIFMNYLRGNMNRMVRLGAKPAVLDNEKFIPRVKPFRDTPEREIALYGRLRGIDLHQTECPYVDNSLRFDVRDFLNDMEAKRPSTKYTSLRAFDKLLPALQNMFSGDDSSVKECDFCGEITSGDICKTCQLREKI